ncbi:MAG TPA: XRE family transcriptional regulator [Sphingomicrobium sp.]|jgi:transcriptional regulator with XRE-family HTH domain|nr:XRE family transcriptional regulator [Sphingomicrobium sp.]
MVSETRSAVFLDRTLAGEGPEAPPGGQEPGHALHSARVAKGLTLRELASRVGMPYSTLSKLENGKMSFTYDKLIRLAQGLGIDLQELMSGNAEQPATSAPGRRSVTRAGEEPLAESESYNHFYPAADLVGKMMTPILIDIRATSLDEMGGLVRHSGEEFLYVLRGEMELHSDLYVPLALGPGDCVYFDSAMAHAYIRTSAEPCVVLSVCAGRGIQNIAEAAAKRM